MGSKQKVSEKMNFEEALTSLEEVVNEIESNPLELEELVQRYERGMLLLKHCRSILDDTKKRLIVLNDNSPSLEPASASEDQSTPEDTDEFPEFRLS